MRHKRAIGIAYKDAKRVCWMKYLPVAFLQEQPVCRENGGNIAFAGKLAK